MKLRLIIALIGGILMGLTPAPVSAWPLAWVALVPLWILIVRTQKVEKTYHRLSFLLYPLFWGIGYHGLALFWITGIHPMTWLGVPWLASLAIAIFAWTFITLWGAALVIVWAAGIVSFNNFLFKTQNSKLKTIIRVLVGTALWCALETFWSFGSLWWTSLSYTQSPHNLAILHLGQISGPSTVTAAIVAVNGLIAELVISHWLLVIGKEKRIFDKSILTKLLIPIGLLVSLHIVGFGLYNRPLNQSPETALKVGIIQGNVPNQIKLYSEGWRRAIEGYTSGYRTLADRGVDAVLTPETALPFFLTDANQIPRSFYSAVLEKGVVAWVGGFGQQGRSYTNSLFTITGDGQISSRYDKIKLVPLGEFIPFEEVLGRVIDRLSPLEAHMVPGKPNQVFDTPFGRAIIGICYDSAFAEVFRRQAASERKFNPLSSPHPPLPPRNGGEIRNSFDSRGNEGGGQFILSASNDAHYDPSMPAQHHAQDVMRAIESDRWAVRATNTGYSAIVDPHGRTLWISQINKYELHAATIYRRQSQTLYVRWGDWLTPLLLLLAAVATVVEYYRQR